MGLLAYRGIWPDLAEGIFVAPGAWIIGDVVIGNRSSIWFNTVVRGDVHFIRIGSETCIQDNCSLHVTGRDFPMHIGNRVVIGHKALVHGCTVEDECMIGMGAVILDGCKIGRGSVIAAGSLLPPGFEVPPESVVMGSPGKIKRKAAEEDRELVRNAWTHYTELAAEYMAEEKLKTGTIRGFLR